MTEWFILWLHVYIATYHDFFADMNLLVCHMEAQHVVRNKEHQITVIVLIILLVNIASQAIPLCPHICSIPTLLSQVVVLVLLPNNSTVKWQHGLQYTPSEAQCIFIYGVLERCAASIEAMCDMPAGLCCP